MKKNTLIIVGVILVGAIGWMAYISIKNLNKNDDVKNRQDRLSTMLEHLGRPDIDTTSPTILIYFNSECEHCQWEMEQLKERADKINNYQLLLVSYEPEEQRIAFLEKYNLEKHHLNVPTENVMTAFTGGVPQTFLYKDGNLIKSFKGEVKIDALLQAFDNQ